MGKRLLLTLGIFWCYGLFAQPIAEKPVSWRMGLEDISPIELPPLDLADIIEEDLINDLDKTLPWRYGVERSIVLNPYEDGEWEVLHNGDRIWRVAIKSPDAINLSINFSNFQLPEGTRLQMFNQDRTDYTNVYTADNNRLNGMLGSWFVFGDEIVVEYYQPAEVTIPVMLEINEIIHGYRMGAVEDFVEGNNRGLEDSGDCNYDVNCSIGSDYESKKNILKKTVALLNLGNGHLCSSVLVNNALQDKKPYLLTANHCLDNSDPAFWSVRFNWVSPDPICGTVGVSADLQTNFTISGATLRANNAASDFALVELSNPIPSFWDVAFAGWDNSDFNPEFQVGIHHPSGDIMKICRDNDPAMKDIANGTDVWLIRGQSAGGGNGWDIGTTESGSSGSPLFNENGQIIGQLYAGWSQCNGTDTNNEFDIYGRFATSWDRGSNANSRLKDWLDPDDIGLTTVPTLENSLNIGEFEYEGQLEVYPNPASEYVIVMNTRYPNLNYELYNVAGQRVSNGNMFGSENLLNVGHLPVGIYFLRLIDGDTDNDITKKIIVQRR